MAWRIRILFLNHRVAILWLLCITMSLMQHAFAADEAGPLIPVTERSTAKVPEITADDFEAILFTGVLSIEDFGTPAVYGLRLAYHVTDTLAAEVAYGKSQPGLTSYERLSGGARLLTDKERDYDYYDLLFGYDLLPGETFISPSLVMTSALYLVAGVGSTHFAGNRNFTATFGAGYRLLPLSGMALHADVRDHLFKSDLLGVEKTTHNIEISIGLSAYF